MARTLAITYAGLTLGAGQLATTYHPSFHLTGKYSLAITETDAALDFEVVVQNADQSLFLQAEAALIAAYSRQDQALLVVLGGTTRHDLDPADNTGFNARARARKVPGADNTARSARYSCSVRLELPASQNSRAGRRSASVDVSTSPAGRRSLVISGVYTALANNAARAQFQSDIATYSAAVIAGLTGTFELVGAPSARTDDQDKTITFSRAYREVISNQAQGFLDHPAIVDPRLTIARTRTSADSSGTFGTVEGLRELQLNWSASVAIATTTNLVELWEQTVRPHLIAEAERVGGGSVAITRETPLYDQGENTLAASMIVLANPGTAFLRASFDVSDSIDYGVILKPVWDGNPFSRDKYLGSGSHVRTVTRRTLRVASGVIASGQVVTDHGAPPRFSKFELVRESRRARGWNTGLPDGSIPLRMSESVYVYVRAEAAKLATGRIPTGGTASSSSNQTQVRQPGGGESETL